MNKLPTAEEVYRAVSNRMDRLPVNKRMSMYKISIEAMNEHTAAHTAALQERIKELQAKIASYESAIDGLKKVVDSLYKLRS